MFETGIISDATRIIFWYSIVLNKRVDMCPPNNKIKTVQKVERTIIVQKAVEMCNRLVSSSLNAK
jgi:hypothetical protein